MSQIINIIAKIITVLLIIFGGMVTGAVIIYFISGTIYIAVYGPGPARDAYECARGLAVGYLSIFGGGLLGIVLGCVSAKNYLKPLRRERADNDIDPGERQLHNSR
jgi:hypothetical protein